MDSIIDGAIILIENAGFSPLFILGLVISLFFFWLESHKHKDRNSIFDMWIITVLVAIFWGRLSFILVNWGMFANLPWSLAPYERYGEVFYFFRLLPWRFFDITDGGFLFTAVFAAYLIFAFFYNVYIKKWSWREMFLPVIISAEVFLAITLVIYGALTGFGDIVFGGLLIGLIVAIFFIILMLLRIIFVRKNDMEKLHTIINFMIIAFVVISFSIITQLFLSYDITFIDRVNVVLMNLAGIVSTIYFVFIEKDQGNVSGPIMGKRRSVTLNINKPFKSDEGKHDQKLP